MQTILILDDDEFRHTSFKQKYTNAELVHTYTAEECIEKLKHSKFDYLFLDHDLGGLQMVSSGDGTGYEVAKWVSENVDRAPTTMVVLHSLNPVGRDNMQNILKSSGIEAIQAPFVWTTI